MFTYKQNDGCRATFDDQSDAEFWASMQLEILRADGDNYTGHVLTVENEQGCVIYSETV